MFKSYTSNDNLLLPPCLGDFIPQNDPVRVVHRIIEQINLEKLYRRYSPQGCSAYHPRMMLQILVYAYLRNIYSSRRIEEFCRNDIRFMWLTGNVTPDHNTINRFRSSRLKDVLKTIFATIVKFLVAEGFVSLDVACTDGTKMEAILVYAYLRNIYSSRRIEEFCRNDIRFMWLTGNVTPDHNTINRFRSSRLKDVLKTIFATIVKFLVAEGFVSLDVACTDGTKMEADANRYTFVWGKSIHTRISRIAEQLEEIWQYAESVTKQELRDSAPITYQDITPEKVEKALCQIDDALNGVDADRKMKAKVRRVRKSWPEQLRKYESQGKILDGRNSYSKTDNDATFMRMKEDHMRNGQLKPGYNPQISTNRQFILNYTIHQCAGDTSTYPLHMDNFHSLYGRYPDVSVCDAGYGSEENYLYAFRHGIETFIKYNNFHKEQKRNFRNDPFLSANFYYNEETDGMYCPMGQRMERLSDARRITDNGFVQTISRYRARNCKGCPLRCRCHRSRSERIVQVNHRLRKIKEREREKLLSDEGLKYRSQRPQDVEAVFGNLKNNKHFKRFHLRGLKKVEIEFGLLAIAHNLAKVAS